MRTAAPMRKERLSEEEAYRRFSEFFDFDLYCLELEYGEQIGVMIRLGLERALDHRQQGFERMLAQHPDTIAENRRRAEARRLEAERKRRLKRKRRRELLAALRQLAGKWHAKLIVRAA